MTPKRIILHCSATKDSGTVSWQAIRIYHTTDPGHLWSDIGYHFGIELVNNHYEILMGRVPDKMGSHCRGQNYDSLGICFVGDFDQVPPMHGPLTLGLRLVSSLCRVLHIPREMVFGHREFDPKKTCPGLKFDLDGFRNAIEL